MSHVDNMIQQPIGEFEVDDLYLSTTSSSSSIEELDLDTDHLKHFDMLNNLRNDTISTCSTQYHCEVEDNLSLPSTVRVADPEPDFDSQAGGENPFDAHPNLGLGAFRVHPTWTEEETADIKQVRLRMYEFRQAAAELEALKFNPQSGSEGLRITMTNSSTKSQNVAFADQHSTYITAMESEMDETRMLQDTNDATLDNFFSRPIKIYEAEWGTGTSFFESFDPWTLYFGNTQVTARINNYNLLRAKLHIKIVLNGNGFQYGRCIASYLPFSVYDNYSVNSSLVPETIVQASQQPHVFLDPTTSTGGEMILPMFWHRNYISIAEANWDEVGVMTIRSINDLRHANGATDQVTVSVFAWAEDVAMSVLTSVTSGGGDYAFASAPTPSELSRFDAQSGTEVDEANRSGMISGPATALANIASKLAHTPVIGPYMMATSQVSGAAAAVAKLFGFSRPTQTENPCPFRPTPISELSVTTTPDTVSKFTVDDKQELSIDSRIAGLGSEDPLSIVEIAKRESYLTKFDWDIGTAPETLLWNCRVSPVVWAETLIPSYHLPACAAAALPFKYWTGTMKFRFQIVCSTFHKGRIKIVYDPNFISGTTYNLNYLQIIDIADTTDFTVEVGNGQPLTLLDHSVPGVDSITTIYSTSAYGSREAGNGVLGVYVVNELTTPNSTVTNDIEVNVYVSMGDDFEVFVPDEIFQTYVFKPQSGEEIVPEGQKTSELDKPEDQETIKIGPTVSSLANINKVYTGETIKSFRQLLKRYNLHTCLGAGLNTAFRFQFDRLSYPYFRGNVSGAINTTGAAADYNYSNTVMMHWVSMCFSGWRGSIRYKYLARGSRNADDPSTLYITRIDVSANANAISGSSGGYISASDAADSAVYSPADDYRPPTGAEGCVFRTDGVNLNAEFEVPFYSNERFIPGKGDLYNYGGTSTPSGYRGVWWGKGATNAVLDVWTAAGEDWQPYFWTGMPPLYFESSPPAP
jgi:hypothetical protein